MSDKPLLITLGDSNGLGPELACRLLGSGDIRAYSRVSVILIGSEKALLWHCSHNKLEPFWERIAHPADVLIAPDEEPRVYLFEPEGVAEVAITPGEATTDGGKAAGLSLTAACEAIREGVAEGMVTLPLHKAMLQEAGFDFPGHTEFLARFAGLQDEDVCMHLCGDALRVSLVTTHPPLRLVPELVTFDRILHALTLTTEFTRRLGLAAPVAVCGLNPHAGESGKIGHEDEEVVAPAVKEAKKRGMAVEGPFPADTIFQKAAQGTYSAVLAMYHDQGLGPLKLLHFSRAVNVTLGLPFVRTSVDHGTGFDITGTGQADTGSFEAALSLAAKLIGSPAAT